MNTASVKINLRLSFPEDSNLCSNMVSCADMYEGTVVFFTKWLLHVASLMYQLLGWYGGQEIITICCL